MPTKIRMSSFLFWISMQMQFLKRIIYKNSRSTKSYEFRFLLYYLSPMTLRPDVIMHAFEKFTREYGEGDGIERGETPKS